MNKPNKKKVVEFDYSKESGIVTMLLEDATKETAHILDLIDFNFVLGCKMGEGTLLECRQVLLDLLGEMLNGAKDIGFEPAPCRSFSETEMNALDLPEGVAPGSKEHAAFLDYMEQEMESSFYGIGQNCKR